MNAWQIALIVGAALLALLIGVPLGLRALAWRIWFATKRGGPETPKDSGLVYDEHWIRVDGRQLQAWFVRAPAREGVHRAVLLFQGGNDVISELGLLQKYLFDHGLSSLAFDFAGNGRSTGRPNVEALAEDGRAALRALHELMGAGAQVYAWGFSSGTGRLLAALSGEDLPPVAGVILMGPFTSSCALMMDVTRLRPRALGPLLFPEYWDNRALLPRINAPVLIVHSRADEAVPFAHGEQLAQMAGRAPIRLHAVDGLKHNDCWNPIHEAYWEAVWEFVGT